MIVETHGRVWRDGHVIEQDFPLSELDQKLADSSTLTWFDLVLPPASGTAQGDEQLPAVHALADELGLDWHAVEDAVTVGERAKATRYSHYTFVTVYDSVLNDPVPTTTRPSHASPLSSGATALSRIGVSFESRVLLTRVSAFVMPSGLVTVRRQEGFDFAPVLRRWDSDPDMVRGGVGALLHGLLDVVVDHHFETIQSLDDGMEELEDQLFDESVRQRQVVQRRVYQMRKELVEIRRAVLPMREVVNTLTRPGMHGDLIDRELAGSFDDLYDHVLRASEWVENLRDMISSIFETNLSLEDARLNMVMKKLAGWAAVIAVPTAVTGWFGQNVPYPGFDARFGLWQSTILIVVGTIGLYLLFRKKDWI